MHLTHGLVQPNMTPALSFSGTYQNRVFIVGVVPIIDRELEFIFRSDHSDRMCVYI